MNLLCTSLIVLLSLISHISGAAFNECAHIQRLERELENSLVTDGPQLRFDPNQVKLKYLRILKHAICGTHKRKFGMDVTPWIVSAMYPGADSIIEQLRYLQGSKRAFFYNK